MLELERHGYSSAKLYAIKSNEIIIDSNVIFIYTASMLTNWPKFRNSDHA